MRPFALLMVLMVAPGVSTPAPAAAQQPAHSAAARMTITVVEDADGQPLESVQVRVTTARIQAATSWTGRAELTGIRPGQHIVVVQRLGYESESAVVEFAPGAVVEAEFRLRVRAVALSEVEVRADRPNRKLDRTGFYDRQQANGFGSYVGEGEIARRLRTGANTIDVLRTMRGVTIVREEFARVIYSSRGNDSVLLGRCMPELYVDGVLVRIPRDDRGRVLLDIEHVVPLAHVAAIEVYPSGGSAPAGLGGGFGCGSIVFWTSG